MTLLPKKLIACKRFACKRFAATERLDGTSTRAFQIGSGKCSLLSAHHIGTQRLCVLCKLRQTEGNTIQSHQRFLTPTHSRRQMITSRSKQDLLYWLRRKE